MAKFELPTGWYRDTITELVEVTLPPILGPLDKRSAWTAVPVRVRSVE